MYYECINHRIAIKGFFQVRVFSVLCFVFAKHDICGMKNIWKHWGKNSMSMKSCNKP